VRSETATLVELTIPFAAAVKGGDVERLYFVARVHYDPIEPIAESLPPLGNRARPLMDEVAGKVTGEEERYSHTDLVDFQRNPDGVNTVHAELRAVLADRDPTLAETLDTRFAALQDARDEGRVRPYTSLARAHVLDEHDAAPRARSAPTTSSRRQRAEGALLDGGRAPGPLRFRNRSGGGADDRPRAHSSS
jgi:hypothetical protein